MVASSNPYEAAYENGIEEGLKRSKLSAAKANVRGWASIFWMCCVALVFIEKGVSWGVATIAVIALIQILVWLPELQKK